MVIGSMNGPCGLAESRFAMLDLARQGYVISQLWAQGQVLMYYSIHIKLLTSTPRTQIERPD